MTNDPPYLILTSFGVTPAWTIDELVDVWVEVLNDPSAEIWAEPPLTRDERLRLADCVLVRLLCTVDP